MASTMICSPRTHFPSATTDQVKDASSLEDRLKYITQIKRIRVSEFFKDFDPLRSGFITSKELYTDRLTFYNNEVPQGYYVMGILARFKLCAWQVFRCICCNY